MSTPAETRTAVEVLPDCGTSAVWRRQIPDLYPRLRYGAELKGEPYGS